MILVLGMHRGGTSALARGVGALGAGLGDRLMQAVPDQNAAGFWEDLDVVALDDRVLLALGRTWDSLEPIAPAEWAQPELARLADEALALVQQRLAQQGVWAVKDPRASRLLPFWQPVLARAGVDAGYVIALRNPLSVARSLAVRDAFPAEKSHLLWLGHMLAAIDGTAEAARVVVDYDRLLLDPRRELERAARALSIPVDDAVHAGIAEYANDILSFDLRHSAHGSGELRIDPRVPGLVADAFDLLEGLAGDSAEATPEAFAVAWAAIGKGFRDFAPALRYVDACDQRDRGDPAPAPAAPPAQGTPRGPAAEPAGRAAVEPAAIGISVVVPLYNHRDYIAQTMASIFSQTLAPTEVIVVDDGSTDDSATVMRSLCERYPGIVFWSQPNQGAHQALNAAIHRATGDLVAILNSDDLYDPGRLAACAAAMIEDPGLDAVATLVRFVDHDGAPTANAWYEKALSFLQEAGDLPLALLNANLLVSTSNFVLRRRVFRDVGYFAPLRYTHDLEFALRLLAGGRSLRILQEPLLGYRVHARNTIAEDAARVDVERAAVFAAYLHLAWRNAADRTGLLEHLGRMADTLESQALADLVEYFASLIGQAPRQVPAGAMPPACSGATRPLVEAIPLDWLAGDARSPLLSELVRARRAVLARRATPPFWLRSFEALAQGKAWLEEQNRSLEAALRQRDAVASEQAAWIARLEEARDWHVGQTRALEEALAQREALVAEQAAWMARLEEARAWHEEQNGRLQAALDRASDEKHSLELAVQASARSLEAAEQRLHGIEQSRAWLILRRLRLIPPRQHPDP